MQYIANSSDVGFSTKCEMTYFLNARRTEDPTQYRRYKYFDSGVSVEVSLKVEGVFD